tara:strand:+ start:1337 stop:1576 length:240 start_codon:yes stop_codon:yes gene_type:complete
LIFRKLERLYLHKLSVLEKLSETFYTDADPEVIAIRTSDLHMELDKIDKKIKFEESMKPFIYMLISFIIISLLILILSI